MKKECEVDRINSFQPIAHVYDQLVAWAPYEKWVEDLISRLKRYGVSEGATILDVACGTGLSSLPLCRRGFDVTGVDCSRDMLRQAKNKAREGNMDAEFIQDNLLHMHLNRRFDVIVCMHSGLDYILDLDRLQEAFMVLRKHMKPGGLFTFDKCLDEPEFYHEAASNSRELQNGTATFEYDWDPETKIFRQVCVICQKEAEGESKCIKVVHEMRAVPPELLIQMLRKADFEMLEPPYQFSVSDPGMGIFRAV